MSKYQDLCNAYRIYDDDRIAYADRSRQFIANLVIGFISFLEAPKDRARSFPPDRKEGAVYSPLAATLDDDGWWRIIVEITLSRGENTFPEMNAQMLFKVRAELDKFLIQIGDSDLVHEVTIVTQEAMQPIFNEAFKRSNEYFSSGLQRFLDETYGSQTRKIGFSSSQSE